MDSHGDRLAQASGDREEIIYAEIDPSTADDKSEGVRNIFRSTAELYSILVSPLKKRLFQTRGEDPSGYHECAARRHTDLV
jgi:hypothetical protein